MTLPSDVEGAKKEIRNLTTVSVVVELVDTSAEVREIRSSKITSQTLLQVRILSTERRY